MPRRDEIPPTPPQEQTPAELVAYQLHVAHWNWSQKVGEDEYVRLTIADESGREREVLTVVPVGETLLLLELYIQENERRLVFRSCAPLELALDIAKKTSAPQGFERGVGFQLPPPSPPHYPPSP